jgi:hypothetical protein
VPPARSAYILAEALVAAAEGHESFAADVLVDHLAALCRAAAALG